MSLESKGESFADERGHSCGCMTVEPGRLATETASNAASGERIEGGGGGRERGGVNGEIFVDDAEVRENLSKGRGGGGEEAEIGPTADARDKDVRRDDGRVEFSAAAQGRLGSEERQESAEGGARGNGLGSDRRR